MGEGDRPGVSAGPLLTVPEVAERLSISRRAAYSLVERGGLASVRIGRNVRVAPEALEAFIAAGGEPLVG